MRQWIFVIVVVCFAAGACTRQERNVFVLASEGEPREMEEFLKDGGDVNTANSRSASLLHLAAAFNPDPDMVTLLLQHRADPEARDREGNTPLHLAARLNGNPEMITRLIKGGSDVNARNSWGATPLILAAWENRNSKVLERLLDSGADPSLIDHNGETARDFIRDNRALEESDIAGRLQLPEGREEK